MGAAVEGVAAHIGSGFARDADGQQHPALERALADRVVAVIGQPQCIVGRYKDTVRPHKHALAPTPQEIAVAVEDAHRMLAAIERVYIVIPVDADRGDIGVEFIAGRQFRPILSDLVAIAIGSEYDRHGALLL